MGRIVPQGEGLLFMSENEKCAHPACNCIAPEGSKYCSQYCNDASDTIELACNCNHPGCAEGLAHPE